MPATASAQSVGSAAPPKSVEPALLLSVAQDLRSNVDIRDRATRFRVYPCAFVGRDAVTWLAASRYCPGHTREEAVALGQALLQAGFFHHGERRERSQLRCECDPCVSASICCSPPLCHCASLACSLGRLRVPGPQLPVPVLCRPGHELPAVLVSAAHLPADFPAAAAAAGGRGGSCRGRGSSHSRACQRCGRGSSGS